MESKTQPLDAANEETYSHHAMAALTRLVLCHDLNGIHIWSSNDEGYITYTIEYGQHKITGTKLSSTILSAVGITVLRHCARCNQKKKIESFIVRAGNSSGFGNICSQCNRQVVASAGSALTTRKSKRPEN